MAGGQSEASRDQLARFFGQPPSVFACLRGATLCCRHASLEILDRLRLHLAPIRGLTRYAYRGRDIPRESGLEYIQRISN
jgi:hypothetical protein